MKVLLIEDEEHKAHDLTTRLNLHGVLATDIELVGGVRQAVLAVAAETYDLVIVDMALPTFSDHGDKSAGGAAQAVGGVEVLRTLSALNISVKIIIVTQYPDIIIGGNRVRLHNAARILSTKYKQEVLGAVLYSYKTPEWEESFDSLLGRIK